VLYQFPRNAGKKRSFFYSQKNISLSSRYVLLTFPQVPVRYNAPSYVERLLLPERFPALFQNIIQNRNNK
jgi:hypothetical protein